MHGDVSWVCRQVRYSSFTLVSLCTSSQHTNLHHLPGNTVFLALGASGQPASHPQGWIKSLISILFFLLGCIFFAQTRRFRPSSRLTLSLSLLLQSICIVVAAALVQSGFIPSPIGTTVLSSSDINYRELVPLAFLAFQSGGQIVTSRLLGFNEVPTTVLTSVYCDLAMDQKFFTGVKENVKRNRRFCSVVAFLIGGIAGGWISRGAGLAVSFWIAAGIKFVMCVGWVLWKADTRVQLSWFLGRREHVMSVEM